MRLNALIGLTIALSISIAACQSQPPTQIVLVVTATPTADDQATITPINGTTSQTATTQPTPTTTPQPTTPPPTPTQDPRPAPIVNEIQVAEQLFEGGRMFWVQPGNQIWVMLVTGEGSGEWRVYDDTFVEEETAESDPELTPPAGFEQPRRGFGKLWRENPELREALGWAITPEFGYVTRYEYHPGVPTGEVDAQGTPVPVPGYHILFSLYEEAFRFNEADQTWQLN